jgi:hypothetical protein
MRRNLTLALLCALACSVWLYADESVVDFDEQIDFSTFRTFALREASVDSGRPEIDNPLFVKNLGEVIRNTLTARRLVETANRPDLLVDYRITGDDVFTTRRGQGIRFQGLRVPSPGPQSVRYTQGTLVVDLMRPGEKAPAWRGMYRDDEKTGAKLVEKLLTDATKLLAQYPPKRRK